MNIGMLERFGEAFGLTLVRHEPKVGIDLSTCRGCISWKRWTAQTGACWHPSKAGAFIYDDGRCEFHTRKTIWGARPEPGISAGQQVAPGASHQIGA